MREQEKLEERCRTVRLCCLWLSRCRTFSNVTLCCVAVRLCYPRSELSEPHGASAIQSQMDSTADIKAAKTSGGKAAAEASASERVRHET
jgi:hypothetical protein